MDNKLLILLQNLIALQKITKDVADVIHYSLYVSNGDESKIDEDYLQLIDMKVGRLKKVIGIINDNTNIEIDQVVHQANVAKVLKEVEEYGHSGQNDSEIRIESAS